MAAPKPSWTIESASSALHPRTTMSSCAREDSIIWSMSGSKYSPHIGRINGIPSSREHYARTFNDPYHLADFNDGGTAQAVRYDISKHIQWGFYMHCTCSVRTDEGTLLV